MDLRDYQQKALDELLNSYQNYQNPILLNACVGAGKSVIIAAFMQYLESQNKKALCLTMSSDLVKQNAKAYKHFGGHPGIFCGSLNQKDQDKPVIFATPFSLINAIKKNKPISKIDFDVIIIDEAHNINWQNGETTYLRIFSHYSLGKDTPIKIVGLTGTPYRGKETIIGKDGFSEPIGNIEIDDLINRGYLSPIYYGNTSQTSINFENVKLRAGKFDNKQLGQVVDKNQNKTQNIMREIVDLVSKRNGCFIYATNLKHAKECLSCLPPGESFLIDGKTKQHLRADAIEKARNGDVKYLVNVGCLTTGVDIPFFDTVAFLRPTESLTLLNQCIGRGLRIHEQKRDCLILDYANNIERHYHSQDRVITTIYDKHINRLDNDLIRPCPLCNTPNKITARRCIGLVKGKRCPHRFEFKECTHCLAENDIASRVCYACDEYLVNPNTKLNSHAFSEKDIKEIVQRGFRVERYEGCPVYIFTYMLTDDQIIEERFYTHTDKAIKFTYFRLCKERTEEPYKLYTKLLDENIVINHFKKYGFKWPKRLTTKQRGKYTQVNKVFYD